MPGKEQTPDNCDIIIDKYVHLIINANANATATSPQSSSNATFPTRQPSTIRIPRVRGMGTKMDDYGKYYVPKVVPIGPYHFESQNLEWVLNLKRLFTRKLFESKHETIRTLYKKLAEPQMVQHLRSFYEEGSTAGFSDMEFTNMMLLDCCFILYYIQYIFGEKHDVFGELKSHQIVLIQQDLFLLENQIPFKVLMEGMKLIKIDLLKKVILFIYKSSTVTPLWLKRKWGFTSFIPSYFGVHPEAPKFDECDHLLHVLHRMLTQKGKDHTSDEPFFLKGINFRNVSELVGVGIQFKPSDSISLSSVEFSKGWLRFSANVKLPPITVNDATKHMLLNLIAYETSLGSIDDAWVTSYVCLLDSLIDHVEDVKILRRAWVLENFLGSDEEVAKLFNEIGTDLVPNNDAYLRTKYDIQSHYESWSNTLFSQLKTEYFKSPWAFLALLGALIALLLGATQTYFTVWSPKGECDDLCNLLKNRHL